MSYTRREALLAFAALLERCASSGPILSPSRLTVKWRLGSGAAPTPAPQRLGLAADRDAYIYVPAAYRPESPVPLVMMLHGAGGAGVRPMERLRADADRTGAIVVTPESRGHTWNFFDPGARGDADFLDAVLDRVFGTWAIDPRRIVIAGFSDGASSALTLGVVNGDLFSGIAAFSPGFLRTGAKLHGKPAVFISHGTRDSILPIDECGRKIAAILRSRGYRVDFREFDGDHEMPPEMVAAAMTTLVG